MLAKQGKLPEARKHLQEAPAENDQERVQLTQAEAQLLRDANEYQAAYDLLGQALAKLRTTRISSTTTRWRRRR